MPGISVQDNRTNQNKISNNDNNTLRKVINVDDLTGRVCYFSLTGDLAMNAFESLNLSTFSDAKKHKKMHEELIKRLDIALLMFDIVILHCSDPYRNPIVLDVLEERIEFVTSGRICFIFSNSIEKIRDDYLKYIENKIEDYKEGFYSDRESESLSLPHLSEEYKQRVIKILDSCKYIIRKSTSADFSFEKLIIRDLSRDFIAEKVVFDSTADLSQILSLSLSLYQLLHAQVLTDNNSGDDDYVFPEKITKKLIREIKDHLRQGNTIARSSLVCYLEDHIREEIRTDIQKTIMNAITLRMDILYSRMNCGQQMILEFHPTYEKYSVYNSNCFLQYIRIIAGFSDRKRINFSDEMLSKILTDDSLRDFRLIYLSIISDVHEYIKLSQIAPSEYEDKLINIIKRVTNNCLKINNSGQLNSIIEYLRG